MLHIRLALPLVLAVGAAAGGSAQVMVAPPLQPEEEQQSAEPAAEQPEPWRLRPAAEPDPALRYRFWPAPEDQVPSNPVPFVSRALVLLLDQERTDRSRDGEGFWSQYTEWSEMPLEELPIAEIKQALAEHGGAALGELARAENLMPIEYDLRMQELSLDETIGLLLPEIQEMRSLARLLHLRGRLAIAEGRWDDLAQDVRVGFRLAEVAGHSTDFLVSRLVGIAITGVMMQLVEEAIQQPDSPNFYWALAMVPDRLFDVQDAIQFESTWMGRIVPEFPKLADEPIGEAAAQAQLQQLAREASDLNPSRPNPLLPVTVDSASVQLILGVSVVMWAEPSRDFLAATTDWGQTAHRLSSAEAVLRASQLKLARLQDSWLKWTMLPPELFTQYQSELEAAMQPGNFLADPILTLARTLVPAVEAAHQAGRRGLQQRNFLATIEALRMHAAAQGSFPQSLDDLRPVPAWPDAIAHQPFGYERISPTRAALSREPRYPRDDEATIEIHLQMPGDEQ